MDKEWVSTAYFMIDLTALSFYKGLGKREEYYVSYIDSGCSTG